MHKNFYIFFYSGLFFAMIHCKSSLSNNKKYPSNEKQTGYDFNAPDYLAKLPEDLYEISGITFIDSNTLACVQDEKGKLYVYDLPSHHIKQKHSFSTNGDFEDLARVGQTMYVLRSNAILYEINNFEMDPPQIIEYTLNVPATEYEGLCYDQLRERLLLSSKGSPGHAGKGKNTKVIYGFDLKTKLIQEQPVFLLEEKEIHQYILRNSVDSIAGPAQKSNSKSELKFRPTAIGLHPKTNKLFLISSPDHMLFIFSASGNLEYLERLDPVLFNQAEGLTFSENGDLYISNEGGEKVPTILKFKYRMP